jgi:hypothetical protein
MRILLNTKKMSAGSTDHCKPMREEKRCSEGKGELRIPLLNPGKTSTSLRW